MQQDRFRGVTLHAPRAVTPHDTRRALTRSTARTGPVPHAENGLCGPQRRTARVEPLRVGLASRAVGWIPYQLGVPGWWTAAGGLAEE